MNLRLLVLLGLAGSALLSGCEMLDSVLDRGPGGARYGEFDRSGQGGATRVGNHRSALQEASLQCH